MKRASQTPRGADGELERSPSHAILGRSLSVPYRRFAATNGWEKGKKGEERVGSPAARPALAGCVGVTRALAGR
jgi:hypothetical protein